MPFEVDVLVQYATRNLIAKKTTPVTIMKRIGFVKKWGKNNNPMKNPMNMTATAWRIGMLKSSSRFIAYVTRSVIVVIIMNFLSVGVNHVFFP